MRILFLSQFFYPEERTAPTNLLYLAEDLVVKGHSVTVLTSIPNHPFGKFYKGYKLKLLHKETVNGVKILRLPLFPDHSISPIRRLIGYLSFAMSATIIGPFILRKISIDVIFCYLPPITIGIPCRIISLYHKSPVMYWMTDLWPENIIAAGVKLGRIPLKFIRRYEKWVYDNGKIVSVNSEGFIANLIEKGVSEDKVAVISDWADPDLFFPADYNKELAIQYGMYNKFNIVYAGNLGEVQELQHYIKSAAKLEDYKDVQFVFIGDGTTAKEMKEMVHNNGISNVRFIPRKPMHEISNYLALADVLTLHLKDSPVFRMQMPSKLIAYMACGKPILCAFEGIAAELVRNANAGLTCQASNDIEISRKVKEFYKMDKSLLKEIGENARITFEKNYTRDTQVDNVENILKNVVQALQ